MKRLSSHRVYGLVFVAGSVAAAVGIAACVSDDPGATSDVGGVDSGTPDTSSSAPPGPDANTPPVADPDAGEEITDGGGLPPEDEDDGGTTDLDGGFDGGVACATLTSGAYVESKCASLSKAHVGGDLTSGTYILTSVTALGSKDYCTGKGYVAYDHRGVLEVTASSATTATFEFLDQYKKTGIALGRPTTNRYDVEVSASGKTLSYTPQACAVKTAPTTAEFSTGALVDVKKRTITLKLPYGTGTANFYFVQQ